MDSEKTETRCIAELGNMNVTYEAQQIMGPCFPKMSVLLTYVYVNICNKFGPFKA